MKFRNPFLEPVLRWMRFKKVISHIPQSCKLLDIGCGKSAVFLKAASSRIESGFGVDFKVENMQWKNIQTVQLLLEDQLPFADATFDVVTLLAVLEHIEQEQKILQEIERVLIPGGKLILTVPSIWAQPVLEFLSYKLGIIDEKEIRDHKRYYTKQTLQKVLDKTGFIEFKHRYFQLWMNNFCITYKNTDLQNIVRSTVNEFP